MINMENNMKTTIDDKQNSMTSNKLGSMREHLPLIVYGGAIVIFLALTMGVVFVSPSARVEHTTVDNTPRTSLLWGGEAPESVKKGWEKDGFITLSNAPGAVIAATENSVVRLDEINGETLWEYRRNDAKVCDMTQAWGETVAVFDAGEGCSEIVKLNTESGQYSHVASYATDQHEAKLVFGGDGHLGLVTPNSVRILRDDLVTTAQFGDDVDPVNPVDNDYIKCNVFDVGIGPNDFVVSSQCSQDQGKTYLRAFGIDPEDPRELESTVEVDTGSTLPVSITAVSMAQMQFVTPGDSPKVYTWQLDKEKGEISARDLAPGEFATGFWDYPGIGYLWGVGETLHVRYGSEDISKSKTQNGVIGNPMTADNDIIAPQREGFLIWNTKTNDTKMIKASNKLAGRKYAFAGDTFVEFNQGKLISYS